MNNTDNIIAELARVTCEEVIPAGFEEDPAPPVIDTTPVVLDEIPFQETKMTTHTPITTPVIGQCVVCLKELPKGSDAYLQQGLGIYHKNCDPTGASPKAPSIVPATPDQINHQHRIDLQLMEDALKHLQDARDILKHLECHRTLDKVHRTLTCAVEERQALRGRDNQG